MTDVFGTLIRELVIFAQAPTSAMEPTVRKGDWLVLGRAAFPPAAAPGDLIVYATADGVAVGRLIARAGQTVTEDAQGISVDGARLVTEVVEHGLVREHLGDRSYLTVPSPEPTAGSWIVPAGHVFVLSDTRGSAEDSRHTGPVPIGTIGGRIIGTAFALGEQGLDWSRSGTRPE
jgi:signal peptidase I